MLCSAVLAHFSVREEKLAAQEARRKLREDGVHRRVGEVGAGDGPDRLAAVGRRRDELAKADKCRVDRGAREVERPGELVEVLQLGGDLVRGDIGLDGRQRGGPDRRNNLDVLRVPEGLDGAEVGELGLSGEVEVGRGETGGERVVEGADELPSLVTATFSLRPKPIVADADREGDDLGRDLGPDWIKGTCKFRLRWNKECSRTDCDR